MTASNPGTANPPTVAPHSKLPRHQLIPADTAGRNWAPDQLRMDGLCAGSAGEMAIERAIFYVADDGVLEYSSSSVASVASVAFAGEFEQRFHARRKASV